MAEAKNSVVMPEDEWLALCEKQCKARRRIYGEDGCDDPHGEPCDECVSEAIERAPAKYKVTRGVAAAYDPLPGCGRYE